MTFVSSHLRRIVIIRADNRCEYCQLSQVGQEATFHVDHVVPFSVGGETTEANLALACVSCSLYKAARQAAIDPESRTEMLLFNPRVDNWHEHFRWEVLIVVGLTARGRATAEALRMNRVLALAIRQEETLLGRHPYRRDR